MKQEEAACESVLSTPHFVVTNGGVFGIRCKRGVRGSREMQDYRRKGKKKFRLYTAGIGIPRRIRVAYRNGSFDARDVSMAGKLGMTLGIAIDRPKPFGAERSLRLSPLSDPRAIAAARSLRHGNGLCNTRRSQTRFMRGGKPISQTYTRDGLR